MEMMMVWLNMDVCRICLLYANAGININNIYQDQYDLRGLIEDLCADEVAKSLWPA